MRITRRQLRQIIQEELARDLNEKRKGKASKQEPESKPASDPWWKNLTTQDDGSLAAVTQMPGVNGSFDVVVYADSSGNPPIRTEQSVDGPVYIYSSGQGVSKVIEGPGSSIERIEVRTP